MGIPVTTAFVAFDLLAVDGEDVTSAPYSERRERLEALDVSAPGWAMCERFDDGRALFAAVCKLGYEGVVGKKLDSRYRPGERGWIKAKNPDYWRSDAEREAMRRSRQRRTRTRV